MASKLIFACVLFLVCTAAAAAPTPPAPGLKPAASGSGEPTTCVPTLQRLLSCLDFIEHRTDAIPQACCVQVNATVAQQPCCLMHVLRGDVAKLIGPEFDSTRAMVNVTTQCLRDASILVSITTSCAGSSCVPIFTLRPIDL